MGIVAERGRGFTLVEMITILVLLGILSVTALSRLDLSPFQTLSFQEELRSAIRFAQKFAIVSGCEVQVDIGASGYSLKVRDDANAGCLTANLSFNTSLKNPAGGTFNIPDTAPPAGIAVSAANFIYGRQGQTFSAANILINVDTQTITVDAVTGYVH